MWRGLQVVTKPSKRPLDIAFLKKHARVDDDDSDQQLLKYIESAIAEIDGPHGIGFALMTQTWRKTMDSFPCTILLPGAPVKSITSVKYIDIDGVEQAVNASDYRVDLSREPVPISPAFNLSWPGTQDVTGAVWVDYVLGESTADAVPADLIVALSMLAASRYEFRELHADSRIGELPRGVADTLQRYRRNLVDC